MSYQHKDLAAGRWKEMPFVEQMANIGSEVERALNWKAKHNDDYSRKAFERALELIDLTLDVSTSFTRLKEVARVREVIVDFFSGSNQFQSTEVLWKKYFYPFNYAARINS
jgi:hypothetical protein